MAPTNLITKKHWIVYVKPAILILLSLFFIYVALGLQTKWLATVILIFGPIIAISNVIKVLNFASIAWSFDGAELLVTRGILPWNKTRIQIPIFDLYDSVVSSGFLGHYLNFGHIGIRRTEGVTSQMGETHLSKAVHFSGIVNQYIQEYKSSRNPLKTVHDEVSNIGIELQRLVDLKNSGALTEEEYERLKKKLMDSPL
ncbi:SHOCT domain-containing protein [Flavobacterium cupreum]|uniref:SHOCT domain-containing protein n=1 Tax=Flavobacterium cupreum TaxID=2133766 RepID=A0A434A784_9FLAO|nr:SHOCT domain-containing protein [Flavobacterium cupreum]RUT70261.1 SHOCT domain-containing protein [Flavobacterium cupreum]